MWYARFTRSLSIIGVGHHAVFCDVEDFPGDSWWIIGQWEEKRGYVPPNPPSMYVQNITFKIDPSNDYRGEGMMHVGRYSKLWLNKCTIMPLRTGIVTCIGATLNVNDCIFDQADTAIIISPLAEKVVIKNSIFKHCGNTVYQGLAAEDDCIQIYDVYDDQKWCDESYVERQLMEMPSDYDGMRAETKKTYVRLECYGNVFEDNGCYPIAEVCRDHIDTEPVYVNKTELYKLKDNVLKGHNGSNLLNTIDIDTANVIYFNDELLRYSRRYARDILMNDYI